MFVQKAFLLNLFSGQNSGRLFSEGHVIGRNSVGFDNNNSFKTLKPCSHYAYHYNQTKYIVTEVALLILIIPQFSITEVREIGIRAEQTLHFAN